MDDGKLHKRRAYAVYEFCRDRESCRKSSIEYTLMHGNRTNILDADDHQYGNRCIRLCDNCCASFKTHIIDNRLRIFNLGIPYRESFSMQINQYAEIAISALTALRTHRTNAALREANELESIPLSIDPAVQANDLAGPIAGARYHIEYHEFKQVIY